MFSFSLPPIRKSDSPGVGLILELNLPSWFFPSIGLSSKSVHFLNVIRICLFFNAILVADACVLERRASQGPYPTAELTEGLGLNCALEALNL